MFDLFIHWNVNPEAFSLGPITVRWYGILYGCAFIMSAYAFKELLKFDKLPEDYVNRALIYMILGTIIGARLGDCFFYNPVYYLQHPLEIFMTWHGGLSSHGGACGILVALFLLGRKVQKPYIWVLDRVVIVIGVAGFFIRMGNLMNSEIYGHITNMPWGFIFERNRETEPKHPTQIYEALYYALTYVVLRFVYRKSDNRPRPYLIFGLFLIMVFGFRFCIEFIKNLQSSAVEDKLLSITGLNMGQLLSAPFIISGIVMLFIASRQQKPALQAEPVHHHHHHKKPKPTPTNPSRNNFKLKKNKR